MHDNIFLAAQAIIKADALLISTGAGMGVDSGLPDFRGNEGFWNEYPSLKNENISFEELANPTWFENDPTRAWGFYGHRYFLYKNTQPHDGFNLLKKWTTSKNKSSFIFTTNVDGHFQKAGFKNEQIYECHGSINFLQCSIPCTANIWPVADLALEIDPLNLRASGELPKCPKCGTIARPNILMFGDWSWISDRSLKQNESFSNWKRKNNNSKITIIELGAGKVIPTARITSESIPGTLVRINPRDSEGPSGTISIAMNALSALRVIEEIMISLN